MDLPHTLLRTVARAFYGSEYQAILEAIIIHNTLRDDDLAYLLGMQTKTLRKFCAKLRDDGLIAVHSRQETREGANRPFARDYYFVDPHRAIDAIKFKIKTMTRRLERKYGQGLGEKKEYQCPQCKTTYTQMEILDEIGPMGILCKRCQHPVNAITDDTGRNGPVTAGHEVQSRLNAQMQPLEDLLRKIDSADVPASTFEEAIARAVPVNRDEGTNPVKQVVEKVRLPPQTVHGMKTEERIQVSLLDDATRQEHERKEAEARERFREQNQLPSWYTGSTVQDEKVKKDDGMTAESAMNGGVPGKLADETETKFDKKQDEEEKQRKEEAALLNSIYAMEADNDDSDDDSDEEEEEEDEEDEGGSTKVKEDGENVAAKRVKIEEPAAVVETNATNDVSKEIEDAYADSDEDSDDE